MEHGTAAFAQGLIPAWPLVVVAILALGMMVYVAIRGRTRPADLENAVRLFRSLDIEAFRNLVDSAEEDFLRDHLPPRKFREIKRQRAWAAFLYAWEVGGAATALAKLGEAAERSSDPAIAASGLQVRESAFRLRFQTLGACLHLLTEVMLPDVHSRSVPRLADQYQRTAETLFRLGRFSSVTAGMGRSKSA